MRFGLHTPIDHCVHKIQNLCIQNSKTSKSKTCLHKMQNFVYSKSKTFLFKIQNLFTQNPKIVCSKSKTCLHKIQNLCIQNLKLVCSKSKTQFNKSNQDVKQGCILVMQSCGCIIKQKTEILNLICRKMWDKFQILLAVMAINLRKVRMTFQVGSEEAKSISEMAQKKSSEMPEKISSDMTQKISSEMPQKKHLIWQQM